MATAPRSERRAERRSAILEAADAILDPEMYELPSAAEIAAKAGIAKGTVYLYFKTKEEIYLALLGRGYTQCAEYMMEDLSGGWLRLEEFLGRYISFCLANPKTMTLACMGPVLLERNSGEKLAFAFRRDLATSTREVAEMVAVTLPPLGVEDARRLLLQTLVLSAGLWQQAFPPVNLRQVYAHEDVKAIQTDFKQDLYGALEALWKSSRGRR